MKLPIVIVIAILTTSAGFVGGMQYQKTKLPTLGGGPQMIAQGNGNLKVFNGEMPNGQAQRKMGSGMQRIMGEIVSIDKESITIKLPDNSSKIVLLSDKTVFSKSTTSSKADLKEGDSIGVFGTADTEGTVTAQDIQIGPAL